ncbi:MAG: hypothetical protein IJD87_05785 [Turicibacter sp.]|nr:hypothetical protein [Turicibacter sp.]
MAVYNVFESTNMASTHYAERIFDAICDVDVENGTFGYLDELADGYSHIYNFKAGTKEGAFVVVADQPVWDEDTCRRTNQRKDKFVIEAGTPFRVRVVKERDEFAIAAEGFASDTRENADVNKYVSIDAAGKLAVADAPVDGAAMNGKIMRTRVMGGIVTTAVRDYGYSRKMYEIKVESLA